MRTPGVLYIVFGLLFIGLVVTSCATVSDDQPLIDLCPPDEGVALQVL